MKFEGLRNNLAGKIKFERDMLCYRIDVITKCKYLKRWVRFYCRMFLKKRGPA
jgi:hypothetical protein